MPVQSLGDQNELTLHGASWGGPEHRRPSLGAHQKLRGRVGTPLHARSMCGWATVDQRGRVGVLRWTLPPGWTPQGWEEGLPVGADYRLGPEGRRMPARKRNSVQAEVRTKAPPTERSCDS